MQRSAHGNIILLFIVVGDDHLLLEFILEHFVGSCVRCSMILNLIIFSIWSPINENIWTLLRLFGINNFLKLLAGTLALAHPEVVFLDGIRELIQPHCWHLRASIEIGWLLDINQLPEQIWLIILLKEPVLFLFDFGTISGFLETILVRPFLIIIDVIVRAAHLGLCFIQDDSLVINRNWLLSPLEMVTNIVSHRRRE